MKGYLIICYIDTEKISHSQKKCREIIDCITFADFFELQLTPLFKNNNEVDLLRFFVDDVQEFLNDPDFLFDDEYYDDDDEDDVDLIANLQDQQEEFDENKDIDTSYEDDHIVVYLQFVSSSSLFEDFKSISEDLDIPSCNEFFMLPYKLSCIDQMEIMKKLQEHESDEDLTKKVVLSVSQKKKLESIRRFQNRYRN